MKNAKLITFLLFAFCFLLFVRPVVAQEKLEFEVKEKVEYVLPYPGILPDHPLYRLKVLRDRIWGFLIRDPLKKSQWCLLMADKRIWAAQMLVDKSKYDLAVSTATKAEKYLERAVSRAFQAKEMGKGEKSFFEKIAKASLKHEEILEEILAKMPEEWKPVIEITLEYPRNANQKILMLLEE